MGLHSTESEISHLIMNRQGWVTRSTAIKAPAFRVDGIRRELKTNSNMKFLLFLILIADASFYNMNKREVCLLIVLNDENFTIFQWEVPMLRRRRSGPSYHSVWLDCHDFSFVTFHNRAVTIPIVCVYLDHPHVPISLELPRLGSLFS